MSYVLNLYHVISCVEEEYYLMHLMVQHLNTCCAPPGRPGTANHRSSEDQSSSSWPRLQACKWPGFAERMMFLLQPQKSSPPKKHGHIYARVLANVETCELDFQTCYRS